MNEKETRSSKHNQKKEKEKITGKQLSAILGTSLALTPFVSGVLPTTVQATEIETQGADTEQAFIDSISYSAVSVANSNDLYASVIIAQALLESSFGNSGLAAAPNYNLFGIKGSYSGETVYMQTLEYIDNEWISVTEPFRSYSSYTESFQDHADVLRSTMNSYGDYHYAQVWKSNTTSYMDATAALSGTYATDPEYDSKLNWLIDYYDLTQYDWGYTSAETVTSSEQSYSATVYSSETYTVVSGDTLWEIAERAGMTVDQLMALNGLSADLITVGQVLYLG